MQVCNAGLQESKYKICNYAIIQTFYIHINLGGGSLELWTMSKDLQYFLMASLRKGRMKKGT